MAFVGTQGFLAARRSSRPTVEGCTIGTPDAETYYLIGEAMGEAMERLIAVGWSLIPCGTIASPKSSPILI